MRYQLFCVDTLHQRNVLSVSETCLRDLGWRIWELINTRQDGYILDTMMHRRLTLQEAVAIIDKQMSRQEALATLKAIAILKKMVK